MMRISSLLILIFFAGVSLAQDKKTPDQDDPKLTAAWEALQGRWIMVGINYGELYCDLSKDPVVIFTISRKGITSRREGETVEKVSPERYVIKDATKSPIHIDLINEPPNSKPRVKKAIYEIDSDTLRIAYYKLSEDRPDSFELKMDNKKKPFYVIYKRVKEDNAKEKNDTPKDKK